jgi:NH3-dependent NAD+ synthetase
VGWGVQGNREKERGTVRRLLHRCGLVRLRRVVVGVGDGCQGALVSRLCVSVCARLSCEVVCRHRPVAGGAHRERERERERQRERQRVAVARRSEQEEAGRD